MIGVVIWSSEQSQRVILWCEDSGALAYARGTQAYVAQNSGFPAVGDIVAFHVEQEALTGVGIEGVTRHASAVRVIERGVFPDVDAVLHEAATGSSAAPAAGRAHTMLAPLASGPLPGRLPRPTHVPPQPEVKQPSSATRPQQGSPRRHLRLAATG